MLQLLQQLSQSFIPMNDPLNQTEIYLSKYFKVILPLGNGGATPSEIASVSKNLQSLGFGLSETVVNRLFELSTNQLEDWYLSVVPILKKMVGAHRTFTPMYPNFPKQVMEASEAELFLNAITHYFGFAISDEIGDPNLVLLPNYKIELRPLLDEFHNLRFIELGSEKEFEFVFTNLVSSNSSLSKFDKEVLRWFCVKKDVTTLIPENIPQKETLSFLVANISSPDLLSPSIKTATDVLRIAVAMSEGDVSLGTSTKFRSFSKQERRFLLGSLEQVGSSRIEDMLRWKERWKRLGERLHPGDFRNRFPNAFRAFNVLRNKEPFVTFNGKIENSIREGNSQATTDLLKQRPGDFARRLDHVLRSHDDEQVVIDSFLEVAPKVSTPVLLQAWCHFKFRDALSSRAFFPKGNAAKVQLKNEKLPAIKKEFTDFVSDGIQTALIERFSKLPKLGNVYIDERLETQLVPFSQRSASRSLRSITRGSRFKLPDGDTIRFFCWWKNIEADSEFESRVDLDLSTSFFDESWEPRGDVSYYNLRKGQCYHSGDITSAPKGACEFIDVNLPSVLNKKIRYVVMSVLSFTRQPFASLPECFGGWMIREKPNSGEIFEPKTVQDKIDISASTNACVPVIIDTLTRQAYWVDLGLKNIAQINNAYKNSVGFSQIGRAIVELKKPMLFDLFKMHAIARGEIVYSADQADTIFGLHEGTVSAFDTDTILSEYLT